MHGGSTHQGVELNIIECLGDIVLLECRAMGNEDGLGKKNRNGNFAATLRYNNPLTCISFSRLSKPWLPAGGDLWGLKSTLK